MTHDSRARSDQPEWIQPQLATLTRDRFSDPGWIFERKLDGERCLAFVLDQQVRLMSRNRKHITATFPEIAEALAAQGQREFVIDGEVVAFQDGQTSFARLQRRLGVARPGETLRREVRVFYYVFDVMHHDGEDLRGLPLLDRKRILRGLLSFSDPLRFTGHRERHGEQADAPYRGGRGRDWLKFKCENAQEFVIGGFTDPQGTRVGFGALLLGYYDSQGGLRYAGKVGTGFDDRSLRSLRAELAKLERDRPAFAAGNLPRSRVHWVEPQLVGQVAFTEWTPDGQLRHPRFQGLRRDKDPADVVREIPS
jgi:bifunctional non-homologous end joining protein LigD